jgi:hypothetical protein
MEENQVTENAVDDTNFAQEQEKMLSQSQVNKIVQHEKAKAAQTIKREMEDRHQKELESIQSQQQQQTQRNENVPRDMDANAIYQQVQERFNQEMQKRRIKDEMDRVANSYLSKMDQGKSSYDDFEDVTKDFDPTAFPQLTYLVAGIDNGADIIYDLMQRHPEKLAELQSLAERSPPMAQARLSKISLSISENRQAHANERSSNVAEPLDRLQSSRVSGSNGKMGIRDLRNQPWLKG